MTHVYPAARIDEQRQGHDLLLIIAGGYRLDLGEIEAFSTQAVLDRLLRGADVLLRIGLPALHYQQSAQFRLRHDGVTGDLDLAELVDLAFGHIHRDENIALVRRHRDLHRVDAEIGVAAILIPGGDLLQIALQRFARVAIALLVPGGPVRGGQLQRLEDLLVLVLGVADDIDLPDLGAAAFLDVDVHAYPVVGQVLDLGVDLYRVFAAAVVLVGQVLGDLIERGAVKSLAGREPDVAQRLLQILGLDVLVALDIDALERGALGHRDNQRVAIAAQLDVAEKAGGVQRAQCLALARRSQVIADVHRQVVEDRALGDALQALDADVLDDEVTGRALLRRRHERRCGQRERCKECTPFRAPCAADQGRFNRTVE